MTSGRRRRLPFHLHITYSPRLRLPSQGRLSYKPIPDVKHIIVHLWFLGVAKLAFKEWEGVMAG